MVEAHDEYSRVEFSTLALRRPHRPYARSELLRLGVSPRSSLRSRSRLCTARVELSLEGGLYRSAEARNDSKRSDPGHCCPNERRVLGNVDSRIRVI